jgi:hypothetical protein
MSEKMSESALRLLRARNAKGINWHTDVSELLDHTSALQSEADRLREVLEPFSRVAGELFARNWNRSDMLEIGGVEVLTAGDFFDARAALSATQQDASPVQPAQKTE